MLPWSNEQVCDLSSLEDDSDVYAVTLTVTLLKQQQQQHCDLCLLEDDSGVQAVPLTVKNNAVTCAHLRMALMFMQILSPLDY